jgi:hypothetical protein
MYLFFIISLFVLIIFVLLTPYHPKKYEYFEVNQLKNCPCDCQNLNSSMNQICENPRKQLQDCQNNILNFEKTCDVDKLKTQNMIDLSNDGFDKMYNNTDKDIIQGKIQLDFCNKIKAILEEENKKLEDDNQKLETWIFELKNQLANVSSINDTCTKNTDSTTKTLVTLAESYQDTGDKYVDIAKTLPNIQANKRLIDQSLHYCIDDPPPPPPPPQKVIA